MALDTLAKVVAALPGQEHGYIKTSAGGASGTTNGLQDLWGVAGTVGALGSVPAGTTPASTAGEALDNTHATAMRLPPDPGAGKKLRLLGAGAIEVNNSHVWLLIDRMVHFAGLVGNVVTPQPLAPAHAALPSRAGAGHGVMAGLRVWATATGASSAPSVAVSYTNSDGVAGRSGLVTMVNFSSAVTMVPMQLQTGDKGVRSIESVTMSFGGATPTTAGNIGFILYKPVAFVPVRELTQQRHLPEGDWMDFALRQIDPTACLGVMGVDGTATGASGCDMRLNYAVES